MHNQTDVAYRPTYVVRTKPANTTIFMRDELFELKSSSINRYVQKNQGRD